MDDQAQLTAIMWMEQVHTAIERIGICLRNANW